MTFDNETSSRSAYSFGGSVHEYWKYVTYRMSSHTRALVKIFTISFLCVFVSGFVLLTLITPKYSAVTVIGPQTLPQNNNQSSASLNLGLSGGLGPLLNTNPKQSENLVAFETLLGTAEFARYLIEHDHFDQIAFPDGIHHSIFSRLLHRIFRQPQSDAVTVGDVQQYLQTYILDEQRTGTQYVQLTYANKDRQAAIKVLHTLLYSGDRLLRQRETRELNTQIAYLSHILQTTTDIEQLNLFRNLLGQKLASKVLVDTQETYAFKIFDAPFAPLIPNSPNLFLLMVLLLVMSLIAAATITVARLWLASNKEFADR